MKHDTVGAERFAAFAHLGWAFLCLNSSATAVVGFVMCDPIARIPNLLGWVFFVQMTLQGVLVIIGALGCGWHLFAFWEHRKRIGELQFGQL
jgi:hypothetical protein